jgi:DNA-binding NarL/FixJ family response regulator
MRLVVADDSLLVRQGLAAVLTTLGHEVCGMAVRAEQVLALVARTRPDIALLDLRLPPTFTDEGLRLAITIRERNPGVGVLLLSQHVEPAYADQLLRSGGGRVGYLLKDRVFAANDLEVALARIRDGETVLDEELVNTLMHRQFQEEGLEALTERERDVLALMAQGLSDRGIAERLSVTPATVDTHVRGVYRKVGITDDPVGNKRVSAVLAYLRRRP